MACNGNVLRGVREYIHARHWRSTRISYNGLRLAQAWSHYGVVLWFNILGVIFIFSPSNWFGSAWSHFNVLPHGGLGIGITCLTLGELLMGAIWLKSKWLISVVLLLGSVAFWTGAFLIGAQALAANSGLMEVPMMMYISVDLLIRSTVVRR